MTLFVGIIIGLALGLIGAVVEVKIGWGALMALGVVVVVAMAFVRFQTDVNVGVLVLLMVVYSASQFGISTLSARRSMKGQ